MSDFTSMGGNGGDPDHPCVRIEVEFNNVGELDIFLADESTMNLDVWGRETGHDCIMGTITRDEAFRLHAWLTEELYG